SGRVSRVTYPGGRYGTITRDSAGRITDRLYPGGREETFTYDASGQLLTANATEGLNYANLSWTRDLLDRPTPTSSPMAYLLYGTGHDLTFTYDADGNLASRSDPFGWGPYNFSYDELDRMTQASHVNESTWQATYDPYTGFRTGAQVPG